MDNEKRVGFISNEFDERLNDDMKNIIPNGVSCLAIDSISIKPFLPNTKLIIKCCTFFVLFLLFPLEHQLF